MVGSITGTIEPCHEFGVLFDDLIAECGFVETHRNIYELDFRHELHIR